MILVSRISVSLSCLIFKNTYCSDCLSIVLCVLCLRSNFFLLSHLIFYVNLITLFQFFFFAFLIGFFHMFLSSSYFISFCFTSSSVSLELNKFYLDFLFYFFFSFIFASIFFCFPLCTSSLFFGLFSLESFFFFVFVVSPQIFILI